ncbi:VOC family protein [Nocardia sp. NEAU-G5]|uniref:VOC family protein n=1 Tax=Nocardia albiluteola TaxID=2842303 RepID=A0ABS6BA91_9NOCA|nr:VOC family protein [Nocardia albiluteola]MBU3067218.1 VOC family protein [Nocardia albiluteola]
MNPITGPIFQVAWVVHDIDAAEQEFTDRYGVDEWVRMPRMHFGPESSRYRDAPADFTLDTSLGYAGGQQLELIAPVSGENLYTEALTRTGPGLHHIAWVPDDFDAALAQAQAQGTEIVQHCTVAEIGMEFVHLSGGPLGSYIELLRLPAPARAMFDSMIPHGYRNPWSCE